MKPLISSLLAVVLVAVSSDAFSSSSQLSDADIRKILISRSIERYSGSCPCPYHVDRAGRRCGGRSAYSRPDGASPLCYPGDVTDEMIRRYRALHVE